MNYPLNYFLDFLLIRNNRQPFYLKLRYLIPSHAMDCDNAVTVCDVRGCEQTVRRVEIDEHIARNQMRHFSLMKKHRQDLLWNIIQGVRTGMILRSF